jgi:hypothetical protein
MILVCCCGSYDDTVLGCDAMSPDDRSAVLRIIILRSIHPEYERVPHSFARWGTDRPLVQCHIPEEQISKPRGCENHITHMVNMLYKEYCGLVVAWIFLSGIFLFSEMSRLALGLTHPGSFFGSKVTRP